MQAIDTADRRRAGSYNAAMAIPQSFLSELLARVDVVEVVGKYVDGLCAGRQGVSDG